LAADPKLWISVTAPLFVCLQASLRERQAIEHAVHVLQHGPKQTSLPSSADMMKSK
jgi:hypothetical protein